MRIPVFVSRPTKLSEEQDQSRERVYDLLKQLNLEPRALGTSDYPDEFPLREVFVLARHCSGGLILGFAQQRAREVEPVFDKKAAVAERLFPTPWNQLEAGILYGLGLPLLIFREDGIEGGVFDKGVTDLFVHRMPPGAEEDNDEAPLREVFLKWHAKVLRSYYER